MKCSAAFNLSLDDRYNYSYFQKRKGEVQDRPQSQGQHRLQCWNSDLGFWISSGSTLRPPAASLRLSNLPVETLMKKGCSL
jgi:hypothetical protein